MTDIREKAIDNILSYRITKYLLIIAMFALLVFLLVGGCYHYYRCSKGLNSKFLWGAGECLECEKIKIDSIIKHDTITITKNVIASYPSKAKNKSMPDAKQIQKVDSGGSGLQSNAPNYGTQAGRDANTYNYGIIPRTIKETDVIPTILQFPNKEIAITFVIYSGATEEIVSVRDQIIAIMRKHGYNNIHENFQTHFAEAPPATIYTVVDAVNNICEVRIPLAK